VNAAGWRSPADLRGETTPSVGDLVRTSNNFHPQFQIVALTDDRAWIRDTQHGTDHIVSIDQCRRI